MTISKEMLDMIVANQLADVWRGAAAFWVILTLTIILLAVIVWIESESENEPKVILLVSIILIISITCFILSWYNSCCEGWLYDTERTVLKMLIR